MTGWPTVALKDAAEIVSGGTPKSEVEEYWDGDIPWVTPKDLSRLDGPFISTTPRNITDLGLKNSSATLLPANSVLFSSRAPIGHVAINTIPMATNQGFKSLVPKQDISDAGYLYHWLRANRAYLESIGNGATFKEVSKAVVAKVELPLPPIEEQRRVAAILDHADALRAKRREALARLDELSQSIFIDMFGDPAVNPMGWVRSTLGEVCAGRFRNGLSPSTSGSVSAKVLTLSAVTGSAFDGSAFKVSTFITTPPVDQSVSSQDLLICRGNGNIGLVGRGYFAPRALPDVTFPDTIIAATVDPERCDKAFLEQIWSTRMVRTQIESAARTTNGTFKVNQTMLGDVKFPLPELARQREFGARRFEIDSMRGRHRASLAELDALFASLQSRAFRGAL